MQNTDIMGKILTPALPLLFLAPHHNNYEDDKTVYVENKYSISIPSFLAKTDDLNDEASLQYQHRLREFYVTVIDEPRKEFHEAIEEKELTGKYPKNIYGFSNQFIENFEHQVSVVSKTEITDTLVDYKPARILNASGKYHGIDAFYSLAFIQGKKRYYQVMAWTLSSEEYCYKGKMDSIRHSLKEL